LLTLTSTPIIFYHSSQWEEAKLANEYAFSKRNFLSAKYATNFADLRLKNGMAAEYQKSLNPYKSGIPDSILSFWPHPWRRNWNLYVSFSRPSALGCHQ
jgi:hypothetical protein